MSLLDIRFRTVQYYMNVNLLSCMSHSRKPLEKQLSIIGCSLLCSFISSKKSREGKGLLAPSSISCLPAPVLAPTFTDTPSTAPSHIQFFPFVPNQLPYAFVSWECFVTLATLHPEQGIHWVTKTPACYCCVITSKKRVMKENGTENNGTSVRLMLILLGTIVLNLFITLWLHAVSTRKENLDCWKEMSDAEDSKLTKYFQGFTTPRVQKHSSTCA